MHKPKIQQKTERRISAGLRLTLVAVLLLAQIALVVLLSMVLRQRMAVAYTVLELARHRRRRPHLYEARTNDEL